LAQSTALAMIRTVAKGQIEGRARLTENVVPLRLSQPGSRRESPSTRTNSCRRRRL